MKIDNKIYLNTKFQDGQLIHLRDLLVSIEKGESYHWSVLDFDAFGYYGEVQPLAHDLRTTIREKKIISISWQEIKILARDVGQFIDLILIGCKDPINFKPYEDDDEMFEKCHIVIIMFDTSWWEIYGLYLSILYIISISFVAGLASWLPYKRFLKHKPNLN